VSGGVSAFTDAKTRDIHAAAATTAAAATASV